MTRHVTTPTAKHRLPNGSRLWAKVARAGIFDCWVWTGARDQDGYPVAKIEGRPRRVTRYLWEQANGPISAGHVVMHTCDNPSCVNLGHLIAAPQRANVRDALAKGRRPQNQSRSAA